MRQVTVLYPITIEVDTNSTIDSILDDAAYILETSTIKPIIKNDDDLTIETDIELKNYLTKGVN